MHNEEPFGPVATLFRTRHAAEATRIANATASGLAAHSSHGRELGAVHPMATLFRARHAAEATSGLAAHSGYGRELGAVGPMATLFRARHAAEAISGLAAHPGDGRGPLFRFRHAAKATSGLAARSGHGCELGAYGIREFVNIKSVWIREGAGPQAPRAD